MVDVNIKNALIDSYNNYAQGIDSKDWPLVRSCFADEVTLNYGDLSDSTGGSNVPRSSDEWVAVLQAAINGFDITRHAITNYRVTMNGDIATCVVYLSADHIVFEDPAIPVSTPENTVTIVGEYTNSYQQFNGEWKIIASQLLVNWSSGNLSLFELAQARAAAS